MPYATLAEVKNYLNIASGNTTQDTLLSSILQDIDNDVNLKIDQIGLSRPIQTEMAQQLASYEARMCALRFRKINATPQEAQQIQAQMNEVEQFWEIFKKSNQKSFVATGKSSDQPEEGGWYSWGQDSQLASSGV
jgi:hypothetical protein